jgi:hypothetical protein
MKAFGYQKRKLGDGLFEMKEVTFSASPTELLMIARFLELAAARMEQHGEDYGHDHFRDKFPEVWKKAWVDVIVTREC